MKTPVRNEQKVRRKRLIRWFGLVFANLVVMGVVAIGAFPCGWARFAESLPDLKGWHRQAPPGEFRAADAHPGYTFDDCLKQEAEVFQQLGALVTVLGPQQRTDRVPAIADQLRQQVPTSTLEALRGGKGIVQGADEPLYLLEERGVFFSAMAVGGTALRERMR